MCSFCTFSLSVIGSRPSFLLFSTNSPVSEFTDFCALYAPFIWQFQHESIYFDWIIIPHGHIPVSVSTDPIPARSENFARCFQIGGRRGKPTLQASDSRNALSPSKDPADTLFSLYKLLLHWWFWLCMQSVETEFSGILASQFNLQTPHCSSFFRLCTVKISNKTSVLRHTSILSRFLFSPAGKTGCSSVFPSRYSGKSSCLIIILCHALTYDVFLFRIYFPVSSKNISAARKKSLTQKVPAISFFCI